MTGDPREPRILAATSVVTVEDRGDGTVDLHLGAVILRLDRRTVASLAGTLRKVTKQMFPRAERASSERAPRLRLVPRDE